MTETISTELQARIADVLERIPTTWRERAQLHDDLEQTFYAWDAEQATQTAPRPDQVVALNARQSKLYLELIEARPWSAYTTCTGSFTIWVQAGATDADAAMAADGIDMTETCGQCGDTGWREVDLDWDAQPGDDSDHQRVIDAGAVNDLLAATPTDR